MEIKVLPYELDETIDDLFIIFDTKSEFPTYYEEIDTPETIPCIVRKKTDTTGKVLYVDIVNPTVFLNEGEFDDFEISGKNIKSLLAEYIVSGGIEIA